MYINYSALWRKLAEKNLSKSDLMELTGLSSRVIAKLAKNETVTTDTIAKICTALNCGVSEVMECSSERELSFYQYSRAFGKVVEETGEVRKSSFVWKGQKYVLYVTKKKATKATRIDCGEDQTLYWTQLYIGGGHGRPSEVKTFLFRLVPEEDTIPVVVIKGKPGLITGLDEGIWVSSKNGKLKNKNQAFVMSEAAFKVFDPRKNASV